MTAASEVIDRALKGVRMVDQPDVLVTAITSTSQSTVAYQGLLSGFAPTAVLEIEGELMLVTEVDYTNKIATVVRGWLETAKNSNVAVGKPIYINPRMFRSDFIPLINEALDDMYTKGLYAIGTLDKTYAAGSIGYDLDSSVTRVLRVDGLKDSSSGLWVPVNDWSYVDNAHGDFASGKALMLRAALPFGSKFRIVYATRFTDIAAEGDDLQSTAGVQPYMEDAIYYYLMSRIMVDLERNRSQMETAVNHQRAQDTPPFLALRTGDWYNARYTEKVRIAGFKLRQEVSQSRVSSYGG